MRGGAGRWRNDKYYRTVGCLGSHAGLHNHKVFFCQRKLDKERGLWGQGRRRGQEERPEGRCGHLAWFALLPAPTPLSHPLPADPGREYKWHALPVQRTNWQRPAGAEAIF